MTTARASAIDKTAQQVIFGTGPLGLSVMDALVSQGYDNIIVVNRSGRVNETLPSGVQAAPGDATDPASVAAICQQAAVVYQCAQPAYTEWPQKFPPIVEGLIEGVSRTGARLVVGDNLYMYGPTNGQPIHEELAYAATGPKGVTRARMAQLLLDAHAAGRIAVAIGRGSDFYGPRVLDSAAGEMLFGAAIEGKTANLLGDINLPHTYTYIRDFGDALVTLGERDEALGQAWHVPNAAPVTTWQFVALVEKAVGRPVKTRAAGKLMITLMGLFVPELREMKEMAYEFTEPYIVDDSKFVQAFGARATPLAEGVGETVAWYRQRH